ncbi:elongation of fatty acids protein [Tripterygium wilfordii]|uniref:Elongation of fatty acids protein n=1 Tax=Tripterygium wilfordii TaxID=458696 RepID=A0A7J7DC31_TRIWF|nr:putative elongation of fatty acids protein DDB_G0272012 [Tripterygium wilfordii]KAF5743910.1 elongation of fatty acids protein [Tripterygium wilfordii]
MHPLLCTLEYWLVKHPKILNFTWSQGETPGSSLNFLTLTILSYLSLTYLLSHHHIPSIGPHILKPITAVHNLTLLLFSLIMALGCTLSIFSHTPTIHHFICFPPHTPPSGPLFFWAYIFYLSKILEYIDTLLIILSESMIRRLTFLHVYHHAMVVIMCYLWLHTSQSMFPLMLVTNASVHVIMYTYYLLCALGVRVRPRWKQLVTDCQILQFFSSIGIMSLVFYYHFNGGSGGCSGIWGWCFSSVFITSLLVLFIDFYSKNYSISSAKTKVA